MKNTNIDEILNKMTLDEKIAMLSGKDFWRTVGYEQYGIAEIEVSDGPCGLRKQVEDCDHLGFNVSMPATAYPSGPSVAASWDDELIKELGVFLGVEAQSFNVDILLGPAMNIQRSPLCGRNFEYYSEDPYLTGEVASYYVNGVQSQGVGACLKHFAANNQETEREYINSVIDERALHEIYLYGFEKAIKNSKPWAVMTALNKINGEYCSENNYLINDTLRKKWGFDGIVISDWWGVNDRGNALKAGLDLEMPFSDGIGARRIMESLENNTITLVDIDDACRRLIKCSYKKNTNSKELGKFDRKAHHEFARKFAEQSIILLKNEDNILPISKESTIGVIGEFAINPKFKMTGSALVNPTIVDSPLEEIKKIATGEVVFAKGYSNESADTDELIRKAVQVAKDVDKVIIFTGLPDGLESEGKDRKDMKIPKEHLDLIEAVANVTKNIIVVLCNGGAVEIPYNNKVKGIFECFLNGQAMGGAIASLLYGDVNPSGKLPVTLPKTLNHISSTLNFPGDKINVEYKESIFVGYRHFDTVGIEPLYPFGHGLSYTSFEISDIAIEKNKNSSFVEITVKVTNTGDYDGAEVVQIYIGKDDSRIVRAEKELKAYKKVFVKSGESKIISLNLEKRDFAYYNEDIKDWYIENGQYSIMIGNSSRNIVSCEKIILKEKAQLPKKITGWSKIGRFRETECGKKALAEITEIIKNDFCVEDLKQLFLDSNKRAELDEIRIRFITLQTQTVINNDIIEKYLQLCNEEYIELYLKEREKINE